jgi:hypothetical protein
MNIQNLTYKDRFNTEYYGQIFESEESTFETKTWPSDGKFIDMGNGTSWASCDVGANYPYEFGKKYAWGEMEPKDDFSKENYEFNDTVFDKNGNAVKDTIRNIGPYQNLESEKIGVIPSAKDFEQLFGETWCNYNGVNGTLLFGENGNCIFLPASLSWRREFQEESIVDTFWKSDYWTCDFERSVYGYYDTAKHYVVEWNQTNTFDPFLVRSESGNKYRWEGLPIRLINKK